MPDERRRKLTIKIDQEFAELLVPLMAYEYKQLEDNIIAEGCRDPLVVWNGTLLDGHNRKEICDRHNIPFKTVSVDLKDKDEAKNWIITNQLGRRNLDPKEFTRLVGMKKKIMGLPHGEQKKNSSKFQNCLTIEEIANQHGVAKATVSEAENFVDNLDKIKEVSPESVKEVMSDRKIKKKDIKRIAEKAEQGEDAVKEEIGRIKEEKSKLKQAIEDKGDYKPNFPITKVHKMRLEQFDYPTSEKDIINCLYERRGIGYLIKMRNAINNTIRRSKNES